MRPPMMRRTRDCARALAVHHDRVIGALRGNARSCRCFLPSPTLATRAPVACHLLGPKRTLPPQYDKFGASFCTTRECDRTDLRTQNSEERTHEEAIAATALAVIVTAGCSSSVDNPPDVTPTDPTTGNGNPPAAPHLRRPPPPRRCSRRPGRLPVSPRLYFSGSPPTARSTSSPRTRSSRNQVGRAMRSMASRRRRRSACASSSPLNPASFSAATVRVYPGDRQQHNKARLGLHARAHVRHRLLRRGRD